MQELSALTRTFFMRTNRLATHLGLQVEDLPAILGMGRRTLFDCRKDDSAVTGMSWAKLDMAERKAGVESAEKCVNAESSADPNQVNLQEFQKGSRAGKMIPVVGWAHAGEAESYDELPKSWQNEIASECPDPKAFAVELQGDSMEPRFYDGDLLVVQPTVEVHSGCFVVARFADDGVIFRRLEMRGNKIVLVPLNPQYESSTHTQDEFSWIYPVWARITRMWKR